MKNELGRLFRNNQAWAKQINDRDPKFFSKLSRQHSPEYLWIGCSDSRVPANQIVGLPPGELFVHRNVANVVVHTDLNCLSVIQYAVDVLRVKHIIVCGHYGCGHYGCGGVKAAMDNNRLGLIDNWLRHVRDVMEKYPEDLKGFPDEQQRLWRFCERNVKEQVANVCETTIVQSAWEREQPLAVHGWIYSISDGLLRDLSISFSGRTEFSKAFRKSLSR